MRLQEVKKLLIEKGEEGLTSKEAARELDGSTREAVRSAALSKLKRLEKFLPQVVKEWGINGTGKGRALRFYWKGD